MKSARVIASIGYLLAGAFPAYAGTEINFSVAADNSQFTVATTSNVVSRQFSGSGVIDFMGNPQNALVDLSGVTDFSLNVNWTAMLDDGTTLFDNFSYGLPDLNWLYANFDGGFQPATLNFATNPLANISGSPSGIVQKPLSVQVAFDDQPNDVYQASTAFWVYPPPNSDQVLSAVGSVSGSVSGLPSAVADTSEVSRASYARADVDEATPVPEPSSWAIMITGLAAVAFGMRKRLKRTKPA